MLKLSIQNPGMINGQYLQLQKDCTKSPRHTDTAVNEKTQVIVNIVQMLYNRADGSSSIFIRASSSTPNLGKVPVSHRGLYHAQQSVRTYVKSQIKAGTAP